AFGSGIESSPYGYGAQLGDVTGRCLWDLAQMVATIRAGNSSQASTGQQCIQRGLGRKRAGNAWAVSVPGQLTGSSDQYAGCACKASQRCAQGARWNAVALLFGRRTIDGLGVSLRMPACQAQCTAGQGE